MALAGTWKGHISWPWCLLVFEEERRLAAAWLGWKGLDAGDLNHFWLEVLL